MGQAQHYAAVIYERVPPASEGLRAGGIGLVDGGKLNILSIGASDGQRVQLSIGPEGEQR